MPPEQYLDIDGPISRYSRLGILALLLYHVAEFVEVGLALPAAGDLDEAGRLEFLDELADARLAHAHVDCESFLAWEAPIVMPAVVDEHGIGDLRTEAEVCFLQYEIWDLRKPAAHDWIVGRQLDVALSQDVADGSRAWWHAPIVARLSEST